MSNKQRVWFKNAIIYEFRSELDIEDLHEKLELSSFKPCTGSDLKSTGWVPPVEKEEYQLFHQTGNTYLLCAKTEEKILPSSVINDHLKAKISKFLRDNKQHPSKTDKQMLREQVLYELVPRAFSKFSTNYLYIDLDNRVVVVDASSTNKAETLLGLLRRDLGSLPLQLLLGDAPLPMVLTDWVKGDIPKGFDLRSEAAFKEKLDKGFVACKDQDLQSESLSAVIEDMWVNKLSLAYKDALELTIKVDGSLSKLKFSDDVLFRTKDIEDAQHQFETDFLIMHKELSSLIKDLRTHIIEEE